MSSGDGESISSAAVTTRHSLVARAVAPDEKDGIKASLRAVASSITSNEDVPLESSTNQFRAADQGDPATTTRLSSTIIVSEEEEPSSSRSSEAAGWIDTEPPAEVTDDDYDAEHDDASDIDGLEEAVTTTTTVLVTPPSPTFARKDTALPKIHLMGHDNKRRNRSSSTPVAEDDDGRLSVFETPRDSRRSSMATPREQLGSALKKQRELESRIIELEYKEKMMIDYQEEQEGMLEELTNVIDQQEEDLFLLNLDIVEKEESDERHLLIAQLEEELNEYLTAFISQLPQQVTLPPVRSSSQCRNSVSTATSPIMPRVRLLHNKFSSSSRPRSEQNAVMTDAASPTRRATILNSSQSTPDSRVSHKQQQPRQNVSSDEQPSAGGEGRRSSIARVSALTMDEEMETGGLLLSSYESTGEQYDKSYVQEDSSWVVFEQDAVDDHSESKILMQQPQELQPASSSPTTTTTTGTVPPTNVVGPSSGSIQLHQQHVVLSPAGQRAGALASPSDHHTKKRINDLESQIAGLVRQQQILVQQIQHQQQQQQRHEGQVVKATDYANEERNAPTSSEASNGRDIAPLHNKNRRGWVSWLLYSSLCLVLYLFAAYGISQALKFRLVRDLIRWLEQQFETGSKHIAEYAERCSNFFNPIGQ